MRLAHRRRRRRNARLGTVWRPRRIAALVAILVMIVGGAAVARLLSVSRTLDSARDRIDLAATALEAGEISEARQELERAVKLLVAANSSLRTAPEIQLAGTLPLVSTNVTALRDTVDYALRLASGGVGLLEAARGLESADGSVEIPFSQGAVPIDIVLRCQDAMAAIRTDLQLPDGFGERSPFLIGPIADAQDRIESEIVQRRAQLSDLEQGLGLLAELLGGRGDRRYLLAVANTAEMRGSGGMYLSYGVLEARAGAIDLRQFGGIDDLALANAVDPATLGIQGTELDRWQGLDPTRLWRNVNLIPDFPEVSKRSAAMYRAATGETVDGVFQIDPDGLGAILAATGPVDVEGVGQVTAENVTALTVNEAYTLFPDRDQRQEVLGDVAEAVFRRLIDGDYPSLRALGTSLEQAVAERHILFDSQRPTARSAIAYFDTDGGLPSPDTTDYLLVTRQNRGRDKLDYYLATSVVVRGERVAGAAGSLVVEVTFDNTAPPGVDEPDYVFGGDAGDEIAPGTYTGIGSLYVPNGAALVEGPASSDARLTAEGPRSVIGWTVVVAAGERVTYRFVLALPPRPLGPYTLVLGPIPQVIPTTWDVEIDDGALGAGRTGPLLRSETVGSR